jgi:uncharacterized Ntn-hydrolase superfamily protein
VTALGLALWPAAAGATWSIVAVDPSTQQVGVAVASCVEAPYGTTLLPYVAGLAPGRGALAAQALYDEALRDEALALLSRGAAPQDVIDMVTAGDPQAATRQYGVVAFDRGTAAFTGASTQAWAGHLQGLGVTVQGNILYGPEVVADTLAAFEAAAPGCPWTLADRLMLALEAGAARGGDNRCSERQSALAAALRVASPGDDPDAPTLDLRIPSQAEGGDNPVVLLRIEYDAWRAANPPDDSGCDAGTGTGTSSGTVTSSDDASAGPGNGSTASGDGLDEGGASTVAAPPPPVVTSETGGTADAAPAEDGACRCRPASAPSHTRPWLLGLLALALRRRATRR